MEPAASRVTIKTNLVGRDRKIEMLSGKFWMNVGRNFVGRVWDTFTARSSLENLHLRGLGDIQSNPSNTSSAPTPEPAMSSFLGVVWLKQLHRDSASSSRPKNQNVGLRETVSGFARRVSGSSQRFFGARRQAARSESIMQRQSEHLAATLSAARGRGSEPRLGQLGSSMRSFKGRLG